MYIPRLDEFTTGQLRVLLNAVATRRYTINVNDSNNLMEVDTLLLWQTQISNAMDKVRKQEQINNN